MSKIKLLYLFSPLLLSSILLTSTIVHAESEQQETTSVTLDDSSDISSDDEVDDSALNGDYDYTQDEEYTQNFYREKATFMSDYDYDEYCKQMYKMGYMDEDYNWSDAAKNFINNMSAENYKKLDENAKEIVQKRIDSGEMSFEDSPYITYDEKQEMIKNNEISGSQKNTNTNDNNGSLIEDEDNNIINEINSEAEDIDKQLGNSNEDVEEQTKAENTNKKGGIVGKVIMGLLIFGIAVVSYSIYRRQF